MASNVAYFWINTTIPEAHAAIPEAHVLIATIESPQQRSLINGPTANQMWLRLSAQYLRNTVENLHVLQARFFGYRYKPDHDTMSHVVEI